MEDFPDQHGGITVQDGGEAEEGVEDADAGEVLARTEKGDSFLLRRVIDFDGDGDNGNVAPGGAYEHFQLGFVARGDQPHGAHFAQRIETVTGLRVRQFFACLHGEPEIGKLVGEGVLLWHVVVLQSAAADDERVRMRLDGFHKSRNVTGVVLADRKSVV